MQYPRTCTITQLTFTHAIEKELQEPDSPGKGCKEIIIEQWCFLIRIITKGPVAEIEEHTPNEIGRETAPEQYDIGYVILI